MSALSDRELVLQIRRGEVNEYGELVRRYQVSVFNVCYRLVGERREAEDLTQEALIRAFERLRSFDIERPFGPWVRRVAANVCLNRLSLKVTSHLSLDEEFDLPEQNTTGDPEAEMEALERSITIRNALFALPAHYRAVIELRHFQNMEYDEMAKTLHLPVNTIKSHLFRARKMLAERLKHV